ncbi:MAG: LysR family transcriptional regulator [Opitutae bacterium]|nr:LysR family transcriptional regulator [Opitutae bacterium]
MPRKTTLSIEPRYRINYGRKFAFGPGKAELLDHLARTGSITEAAKAMEMSYMRAWQMVKSLESGFAEPLVRRLRGGHARGGAEVTPTGREVLRLYRELEDAEAAATKESRARFAAFLRDA